MDVQSICEVVTLHQRHERARGVVDKASIVDLLADLDGLQAFLSAADLAANGLADARERDALSHLLYRIDMDVAKIIAKVQDFGANHGGA